MHSSLTSSFASAAAGGNVDSNPNRRDGVNEWSRSRANGATQTFRRSSQATPAQSRDNPQPTTTSSTSGPYIPPHVNQPSPALRNGIMGDMRYSKEQLLSIYQGQKDSGTLNRNLQELFQGPWSLPSRVEYSQFRQEGKEPNYAPDVCWNSEAEADPFGLIEMSEAERLLFTASVNSPLKSNQTKEPGTITNRKSSVSNHHGNVHNSTSTTTSRPSARRRETTDSNIASGPLSPSESKAMFRPEPHTSTPPPALLRRRTDYKDDDYKPEARGDEASELEARTPFNSLRRLTTGPLSAGLTGPPANPWSSVGPRSAFESMGGFGSFNAGPSPAVHDQEKRPGFGSARGNSRFKDLLQRPSIEDMSPVIKEKPSSNALEKLPEEESYAAQSRLKDVFRTRPNRSETNPYDDAISRSGSAALSNDGQGVEQIGFTSFNPGDAGAQSTPAIRRTHDALSPTSTNPYYSPAAHRNDEDGGEEPPIQPGGLPPFSGGRRDMFAPSSQSPGFGQPRSALGNLSGIQGWGAGGFGSAHPGRDRNAVASAFGDPIFSPMADIQSPGGGFFGSAGFGSASRSSRLGALFPPAMQDQMRPDSHNDGFDTPTEPMSARDPFDSTSRRPEGFRGLFEDGSVRSTDPQHAAQASGSTVGAPPGAPQRTSAGPEQSAGKGPSPSGASSSSNNVPTAQQRQMVMPDRMRWIYRDPQGNVQGPWSGLEMHDWFKAGFFTAELQVKKLEDAEYEPLAQLVRRIGNSREPFLVPQIGIPHGPPAANQGNQWANNIGGSGGAQPPFASSFPSFGTTLTAEQQNALERRKQEEQYLMARQKEHLAQQQMYMKQMQMQNPSTGIHGLQHHSSAHSLQSQPSFGSITSPVGYHPSPSQGPIQPPQALHGVGPAHHMPQQSGREEELPSMMDRVNFGQRSNISAGLGHLGQAGASLPGQRVMQEGGIDMSDPHEEVQAHEQAFLGQGGRNDRLEEFEDLRRQIEEQDSDLLAQPIRTPQLVEDLSPSNRQMPIGSMTVKTSRGAEIENLSLTQQVQRMTAANEKAASQERAIEPPPLSISPLPAPTPNRNRQHVADQLAAESRSSSQTPVEPTSIAPWAQAEMPKGPSLREIQETQAKRAAEQEALLAAARRAQAEQERVAAAAAAATIPPAPGLPATSKWASTGSPASPGPAANAWGAKQPTKPITNTQLSKKTLAQIQKEEEAKKQKAVAAAAAQAAAQGQSTSPLHSSSVSGKRYADLASRVTSTSPQAAGNSWIAVGSGGKPKTPATVVAAPQASRTVSSGTVPVLGKPRPVLQTRTTSVSNKSKADEEFIKWAKSQLNNELNAGINADSFIRNLLELPAEREILREALYASSQTINGDRVSEEWVRRRKLADKGIIEPAAEVNSPVSTDNKNAGWSEVAKKNPTKEDPGTAQAFKVVSKKKTKK